VPARSLRLIAALLVPVLGLVACGPDDPGTAAATPTDGAVQIAHHYGSTTIGSRPQRIVSLDTQWTDVLTALGSPPAFHALDATVNGDLPWQQGKLGASQGFPVAADTIPYERLIDYEPDLIVVSWLVPDEAAYKRLSDIAPTIPLLSGNQVDAWQDIATAAGTILREPERARRLVDDVRAQTARVRDELPGLRGKTVAMANYLPGDAINVVADPEDGSSVVFDELGLAISPTILRQGDSFGRVRLAFENVSMLDADLLVLLTNGADTSTISGYEQLPAVRAGAVATVEYAVAAALNTPTPLSVPYALTQIRPALEAAARR
jgi:iron complex transport system substrate-binding protein